MNTPPILRAKAYVAIGLLLALSVACSSASATVTTQSSNTLRPTAILEPNVAPEPTATLESTDTPQPTPMCDWRSARPNASLPSFLFAVTPAPGGKLSARSYDSGGSEIHVHLETLKLWDVEAVTLSIEDETGTVVAGELEMLEVRETVVVDSKYDAVRETVVGVGGHRCWFAPLEPGAHKATVQVHKESGEVLEYTWTFTITP